MTHGDMHELLKCLLGLINSEDKYKDLGIALISGNVNIDLRNCEVDSHKIVNDLIKMIVTDFLTYNVYKRYNDEFISDFANEILSDFKKIVNEDDVLKYVSDNVDKFGNIIFEYFVFHDQNYNYQCMAVANVVNLRLSTVFTDLYLEYFMTDVEYGHHVLPNNVIYGLDLISYYNVNKNDEDILEYLNAEFKDPVLKNNFLNYILSNVYANNKINGCSDDFNRNIVNLTEKIDRSMKCFYDNKNFVVNLVNEYINIYDDVKWYDFVDIRDSINFDNAEIIYKLDSSYKHPEDVIKNATYVCTIMGEIQKVIFYHLDFFINMNYDNDMIIDRITDLINGYAPLNFDPGCVLVNCDKNSYLSFVKMYLSSICYEYLNYKREELDIDEESVYNYLDSDIDKDECFDLFEDDEDRRVIINSLIEYFSCDSKIEVLSRKKMVADDKFKKLLKFNPYMYLEYRRICGSLLPLETSKSTEYGNLILGKIGDIIYYSNYVNDRHEIKYEDLGQIFKQDSSFIDMEDNEVAGFIVSNIYENLKMMENLSDNEKSFISVIENDQLDIDSILDDEDYYGRLLYIFYTMNEDYFNDDKFRKLRRSDYSEKIKILKKYDPFYDEDYEILK